MNEEVSTVTIYVIGKSYQVPANLAIMKAMEFIGYKFVRGCGCRAAFCGACATLYRLKGSYKLQAALACQKLVEDGMFIATIPFAPSDKRIYELDRIRVSPNILLEYYPEIARCLSCNTCTKACPQDLQVMDYVQAALKGDIEEVANLSFDCLSCGLCAMRCPAEIVPYNVAQLARRLYAKYLAETSEHLVKRLQESKEGKFDEDMRILKSLSKDELRKVYEKREIRV